MRRIPHTFTIVFALIVLAAVLTWVVPAGKYNTHLVDTGVATKEVIDANSYHHVDAQPQTWQIFSSLFNGFCDKADIIIFILMVGGAFWILNDSHAIDVGIMAFLRRIRRLNRYKWLQHLGVDNIIIVLVMLMFSLFGAVFGMSEETIAFTVVFIPLAIQMGYDSIVGVCICYMAAHIGFAGAMLNPFTIGIAQGIADIPIFSGLEYRFFCWIVLTIVGIAFVLWYAYRIKQKPERSPMYSLDNYWRERNAEQENNTIAYRSPLSAWIMLGVSGVVMIVMSVMYPMTSMTIGSKTMNMCIIPVLTVLYFLTAIPLLRKSVHFFILDILFFTIAFLIVGVLGYGWYVMEISALFLAMGIISGVANSSSADDIAKLFLAGCKDILSAALVVGLASGIIFILQDGKVIDTMLYGLSQSLAQTGDVASLGVMYVFQTILNVIMPSGSAKAALTMPIMSQFADIINLSRQTTVLAFQFGDGFTNMITPTSGVLIGVLGVAKIPYGVWLRWVWKFILALIIIGFILMLPTLWLNIPGF